MIRGEVTFVLFVGIPFELKFTLSTYVIEFVP